MRPCTKQRTGSAYFVYELLFPNGKRYYGACVDSIQRRFNNHVSAARRGVELAVLNAIRKYGAENVKVEEVARVRDVESMLHIECIMIAKHKTQDPRNGYNLTGGGDGWFNLTEEQIAERSAAIRKTMASPEFRAERSRIGKEVQNRPELKARLHESKKKSWAENYEERVAAIRDPKNRKRISDGVKATMSDPVVYARWLKAVRKSHATAEFKAKITAINREIATRPEYLAKMSRITTERCKDPAFVKRLAEAQHAGWNKPGVKARVLQQRRSPEYRRKMSEAKKRAFAKRRAVGLSTFRTVPGALKRNEKKQKV